MTHQVIVGVTVDLGELLGRAFLYGLGAMGEAGVTCCLEVIQRELELTMAFCGHTDIRNFDCGVLLPPSRFNTF